MVLRVNSLGIRRSERWLFRDLSFSLHAGEVIQAIGRNGTGKTSLLRCLCGFLGAAAGDYQWGEAGVGVIPVFLGHQTAVKAELTVLENLIYHPLCGGFARVEDAETAIVNVGLMGYEDAFGRQLSAGQTRRVGLARLLLADTRCWVLDEPFTSLDIEGCRWLESKISDFVAAGGSVLLTSHQPVTLHTQPTEILIGAEHV